MNTKDPNEAGWMVECQGKLVAALDFIGYNHLLAVFSLVVLDPTVMRHEYLIYENMITNHVRLVNQGDDGIILQEHFIMNPYGDIDSCTEVVIRDFSAYY